MSKATTSTFREKKRAGEPIVMLTAYDFFTARLVDEAGVDGILVGDSLGMVIQGHPSTLPVTLDDVLYHTSAVARAGPSGLVVGDMPFLTYQVSDEEAVRNAGAFLRAGAEAVKVEGGVERAHTVRRLVDAGIPVMGHIGLTPQSVHQLGGYKLQGKTPPEAARLVADAEALAEAGAFAVVLEMLPAEVARDVRSAVSIPTIGIGAGKGCDGQILVTHDLLGLFGETSPRFVRRYAELGKEAVDAMRRYAQDVRAGSFPGEDETYHLGKGT